MKTYLTIQESGGEGGRMEGRAMGGGHNLKSTLLGRDRIKRENRSSGGRVGWREI